MTAAGINRSGSASGDFLAASIEGCRDQTGRPDTGRQKGNLLFFAYQDGQGFEGQVHGASERGRANGPVTFRQGRRKPPSNRKSRGDDNRLLRRGDFPETLRGQ
jgi:hypothetical protein